MLIKSLIICCICLAGTCAFSQAIDNTASFRMLTSNNYIRFHYENDFFSSSDRYYTQGMNLELVTPLLKKNPVNQLLIISKANINQFGIAIEHNAYTPTSITSTEILYGDRPFAASVFIKTFAFSNNTSKHYRLSSALSLGMIGKVAGAYEIQKTIHRWTNGTAPEGWQYQIKNDLIINYEAAFEKNIFNSKYLLINGNTAIRLGTLNTKISAGGSILIGKLNTSVTSVFSGNESARKQKFAFHVYAQPLINAVLYDATMQGGLLFNRNSPYTLSAKEIERFTYQGNTGIVFSIRSIYLEYFQSVLSREFKTGHTHHWGGLRVGITI